MSFWQLCRIFLNRQDWHSGIMSLPHRHVRSSRELVRFQHEFWQKIITLFQGYLEKWQLGALISIKISKIYLLMLMSLTLAMLHTYRDLMLVPSQFFFQLWAYYFSDVGFEALRGSWLHRKFEVEEQQLLGLFCRLQCLVFRRFNHFVLGIPAFLIRYLF